MELLKEEFFVGVLSRNMIKSVEKWFYRYPEAMKDLCEVRQNILKAYENCGPVAISDPTFGRAAELAGEDAHEWMMVIQEVLDHFEGTGKDRLLRMVYFQDRTEVYVCSELFIERRTFYAWKNEVVLYAAFLAVQRGILAFPDSRLHQRSRQLHQDTGTLRV